MTEPENQIIVSRVGQTVFQGSKLKKILGGLTSVTRGEILFKVGCKLKLTNRLKKEVCMVLHSQYY